MGLFSVAAVLLFLAGINSHASVLPQPFWVRPVASGCTEGRPVILVSANDARWEPLENRQVVFVAARGPGESVYVLDLGADGPGYMLRKQVPNLRKAVSEADLLKSCVTSLSPEDFERERAALRRSDAARIAESLSKPSPELGQTKEQVEMGRWGRPERVNRTIVRGQVREQWVYSGRAYLYFENGRLTAIQD